MTVFAESLEVGCPTPRPLERAVSGCEAIASSWPAPGELVHLRQRLHAGMEQLAAGRHVVGDRILRQVGASLARRHDWPSAARAALVLAEGRLGRGRVADAQAALAEARRSASAAPAEGELLIRIAVLSGRAAVDEHRLDEAEVTLAAAVESARRTGGAAVADAILALVRCRFWRGAYDAADTLLAELSASTSVDGHTLTRAAVERARVAVGRGDLSRAVADARTAVALARRARCPHLDGLAAHAAAFAHLAVGDYAAVGREVEACVRASRCAHDSPLALRAHLLRAEAERRQGRRGRGLALVRRLRRMNGLPPIIAVRVELLAGLLQEARGADVASRLSERTGLQALSLFAPRRDGTFAASALAGPIVEILQCCQVADDNVAILGTLCACVRINMRAAAVACVAETGAALVTVASAGGRVDASVGARVMKLDPSLLPWTSHSRTEGGMPIRYGGRLLGALVVRWVSGATCDAPDTAVLLATAAAAAGPALAAVAARRASPSPATSPDLMGGSRAMADVRLAVDRAARAPFVVLIQGESGSGKELVARALHRQGPRRDRPFCTLNCAALPDDLVESELFGHARGAFTGAVSERAGVFEEAHTGTLFLDEVGELSLRAQAKVLRTIQEGELRRVGENQSRRVDVRLVAATNRDLEQEVKAGRFRLDLLYRLDVVRISLPPLRDRRDDVETLAEHFWREATSRLGSRATLGAATVAALARYDWPGNVRELQNVLAALAVRSPHRGVVPPSALPPWFDGPPSDRSWRLDEARRTFEQRFIRAALARSGGHRARTAQELGLTRQGLTKLIGRLGIGEAS